MRAAIGKSLVSSHIPAIDLFRALAIIMVTGYHVWLFVKQPEIRYGVWNLYAPFMKTVGVAIFVFISGYLTHSMTSQFSYKDFIGKRFKRLVLPYYLALIVWNVLLVKGLVAGGGPSLKDNVTHLLFIHNLHPSTFHTISGVFWYLGLQMQLYCLYLCIRTLVSRQGGILLVVSCIMCLLINIIPYHLIHDSPWRPLMNKSIFSYAFVFIAAVVIKERANIILPYLRKSYVVVGLAILSTTWMFYNDYVTLYKELDKIIIGFLLGLVMLGLPRFNESNLIFRPLAVIAAASYSIYLYNYIIYLIIPTLWGIGGFIIYTIFILCIGIAAYYLVEEPLATKRPK